MNRSVLVAAGLVVFMPFATPVSAATSTLTFDGLVMTSFGPGSRLDILDFSTPEVSVDVGAYDGATGEAGAAVPRNVPDGLLRFWDVGYVGMDNVAYVDPNANVGEIIFTPGMTLSVTLDSFQLSYFDDPDNGPFPQTVDLAVFGVSGGSWTTLWSLSDVLLDGTGASTFTPGVSSADQLRLQWSLSANWAGQPGAAIDAVGIDTITFSSAPMTPAVIPLPATLPLLLGALGLMGWVGRRRIAA